MIENEEEMFERAMDTSKYDCLLPLYKKGGWELKTFRTGLFVLELPMEMGKIYFTDVVELDKYKTIIDEDTIYDHIWRFDKLGHTCCILNSHILPRDLKDLLIEIHNFVQHIDGIDKTLKEYLEE
ncbi:hypothetical protein AKJ51_01515 [candidate division MSBL1 archaeon SCGC-AAA382A20]|uniref:Uncharacterized protein n=1 Tax=candidate division MSBL1 archaeon SCGC-AAA382A20 TaxID=1698280 RepID=A0A133VLL9_9EURY|nr:hypothetical protein AKJ51_01515 [candidate division MSBL1 archaeon SCGC-AAA382A20]